MSTQADTEEMNAPPNMEQVGWLFRYLNTETKVRTEWAFSFSEPQAMSNRQRRRVFAEKVLTA